MKFNYKQFAISIYGDGKHEYEGYYLVVVDEFDVWDNPTQRKNSLYVKSNSIEEVTEFITHIIDVQYVETFKNHERIRIRKMWEIVTV